MALEGKGSYCFSITQLVRQKGNNKVSNCKLLEIIVWEKTEEKKGAFRYSMTITISPIVP